MIAHLIAPLISFAEKGKLPDTLIRVGIRNLLKQRLAELESPGVEAAAESFAAFLRETSMGPIACVPEKANEQHYEVPSDFFDSSWANIASTAAASMTMTRWL